MIVEEKIKKIYLNKIMKVDTKIEYVMLSSLKKK
jgi:hypothetical protein